MRLGREETSPLDGAGSIAVGLSYTWTGGFRCTVYTELMHFAVVLVAVAKLIFGFLIVVPGLAASLISTFADNVSGFSAVWVQSVYQPWIRRDAPDEHYLRISRLTNAAAVLAAMGCADLNWHGAAVSLKLDLSTRNLNYPRMPNTLSSTAVTSGYTACNRALIGFKPKK